MKFLVVGCGSIGRRHMKNLLAMGETIVAADLSSEYRKWVEDNLHLETYETATEAMKNEAPDAVLICTPPSAHIKLALEAVEQGRHVFIEKPVSSSIAGIDGLIKRARQKKVKTMVGYNQRFNKTLLRVRELIKQNRILFVRVEFGQYLPDWRPWQDYRKSYTALKKLGGGIVLDDSHELDYVRWMFGEPKNVHAIAGKISSLEVETEDTAEVIMRMDNAIVSVHMDFVRRDPVRKGEAVSEEGTIKWDLRNNTITYCHPDGKIDEEKIEQDVNETYVDELKHFIDCIKNNTQTISSLEDATKTLELALKIKKIGGIE